MFWHVKMSKIYFWKKQVAKQCTSILFEEIFLTMRKYYIIKAVCVCVCVCVCVTICTSIGRNKLLTLLSLFFFFLAAPCSLWDLSSPTRDWTGPWTVKAWSPNYWTAREAPSCWFLRENYMGLFFLCVFSFWITLMQLQSFIGKWKPAWPH